MRPDYILDAADLALLEVDLVKIDDEVVRGLVQHLVDEVRWYREEDERLRDAFKDARDHAKDAKLLLGRLETVADADWETKKAWDEIDDELDEILVTDA